MNTWIGIDVAKNSLEVCVIRPGQRTLRKGFRNTGEGRAQLLDWAAMHCQLAECHFCLESTGVYGWGVATLLAERQLLVSVENPRRIKHFAVAMNLKCKTDRVDAYVIAEYARRMDPRPWVLRHPVRRELSLLRDRAKQILKLQAAERNRLENGELPQLVRQQIEANLSSLQGQIEAIHQRIGELLPQAPHVEIVFEAITKICGIGQVCGLAFAIEVDVLAFEEAQKVVSFFGYTPRLHESGRYRGQTKITKQGDASVRADFYEASFSAVRFNCELKSFYERLVDKNKLTKKQARVAVARKLLMYCWAIGRRALLGQPIVYPGGSTSSRLAWKKAEKAPLALTS